MKNLMKRVMCLALILMMSFIMVVPANAASKPRLSKYSVTVTAGYTTTLKVKGTSKKVKWSSSNKNVAVVSKKGKIKAKKAGITTITAKIGSTKLNCKVTVKANQYNSGTTPYNTYLSGAGIHITSLYYSSGKLVCRGFIFNNTSDNQTFRTRRLRIYGNNKLIADDYFVINTTVRAYCYKYWDFIYSSNYKKTDLGSIDRLVWYY